MSASSSPAGSHPVAGQHYLPNSHYDGSKLQGKSPEAPACPSLWATYHGGRWQCGGWPDGTHEAHCRACDRMRDDSPVGIAQIDRKFFIDHRQELTEMIHHHEARAKAKHPQDRIVTIEDSAQGILVTTTDIDLARDLGEALHEAYEGELELHYNGEKKLLRVHWRR